jgi:Ca2+-binding RTX toxin-like protein
MTHAFNEDPNQIEDVELEPVFSADADLALDANLIEEEPNFGSLISEANVFLRRGDNIKNITLTGSADLIAFGNELDNLINGNSGNNILDGADGNDTVIGGGGSDILIGGNGNDTYVPGNARSGFIIEALDGGTDTVLSETEVDLWRYENIENIILTGSANVAAYGNELDNVINGNSGNNILDGGAGNDTLIGGGGSDTLTGGSGNDTFVRGNTGASVISEAFDGGIDTVMSENDVALQRGDNIENITLSGSANVAAYGNELDNVITGNSGDNGLYGGAGNDTLIDGGGNDWLIGGSGNDTYVQTIAGAGFIGELRDGGIDTLVSGSNVALRLGDSIENIILTGSADVSAYGNELDNLITGNSGNNVLDGADGNDTLIGGGGNDTLIGGSGNDTYVQTIAGAGLIRELLDGGIDTIVSGSNVALQRGDNIDNITLSASADVSAYGNELDNIITGNSGNNALEGADGNDTLIGGAGDDTMTGGSDHDSLDGGDGNDTLSGGAGDDSLQGGDGDDSLQGGDGADVLIGGTGNDLLDGGDGMDTLVGGGDDRLIGGKGDDTYVLAGDRPAGRPVQIVENAGGGIDTVMSEATFDLSLYSQIENLTLTGNANLDGLGNGLNNVINGSGGNNMLTGFDGDDALYGGAGNDTLIGGAGNDTLAGGTGNNVLRGGMGNDTYVFKGASLGGMSAQIMEDANSGIDTVMTDTSLDLSSCGNIENLVLTDNADIDGLGSGLNNVITGNGGNNLLKGFDGDDTLNGGAGNDTLISGAGNDILYGGEGSDTYVTDANGKTSIIDDGVLGIDTVMSYAGMTQLSANVENLSLLGVGNINGKGNALNNVITGNSGNNLLEGGDGNDTLNGSAGNDTLNGGEGSDTYVIGVNGKTAITENGVLGMDTIMSYVGITLLNANVENLILLGADNINGKGNALNNVITGNSGNNLLNGGGGRDTFDLSAGGRDVIRLDAINLKSAVATVTGFGSDDVIDAPTNVWLTQVIRSSSLLPDDTSVPTIYVAFNSMLQRSYSPDGHLIVSGYQVELVGYTGPVNIV